MTRGRLVVALLVLGSAAMGVALWYAQTRAFYAEIPEAQSEIPMTGLDGVVRPMVISGFEGIDADSSPIRYRACFETNLSLAALTESFTPYTAAEPLTAPGWFACFEAGAIAAALNEGRALAFLSEANAPWGIDRIVAVTEEGRGYLWPQINACGTAGFAGDPLPSGCPPAPVRN